MPAHRPRNRDACRQAGVGLGGVVVVAVGRPKDLEEVGEVGEVPGETKEVHRDAVGLVSGRSGIAGRVVPAVAQDHPQVSFRGSQRDRVPVDEHVTPVGSDDVGGVGLAVGDDPVGGARGDVAREPVEQAEQFDHIGGVAGQSLPGGFGERPARPRLVDVAEA